MATSVLRGKWQGPVEVIIASLAERTLAGGIEVSTYAHLLGDDDEDFFKLNLELSF